MPIMNYKHNKTYNVYNIKFLFPSFMDNDSCEYISNILINNPVIKNIFYVGEYHENYIVMLNNYNSDSFLNDELQPSVTIMIYGDLHDISDIIKKIEIWFNDKEIRRYNIDKPLISIENNFDNKLIEYYQTNLDDLYFVKKYDFNKNTLEISYTDDLYFTNKVYIHPPSYDKFTNIKDNPTYFVYDRESNELNECYWMYKNNNTKNTVYYNILHRDNGPSVVQFNNKKAYYFINNKDITPEVNEWINKNNIKLKNNFEFLHKKDMLAFMMIFNNKS